VDHCELRLQNQQASRAAGRASATLETGKTLQEITAACRGARPNHVGAEIARHKRAGRIDERNGKLYAIHSTGTEQRDAV